MLQIKDFVAPNGSADNSAGILAAFNAAVGSGETLLVNAAAQHYVLAETVDIELSAAQSLRVVFEPGARFRAKVAPALRFHAATLPTRKITGPITRRAQELELSSAAGLAPGDVL